MNGRILTSGITFLLILSAFSTHAQKFKDVDIDHHLVFPRMSLGSWSGDLEIFNSKGKLMSVPMTLEITTTELDSIFGWTIIYGEGDEVDKREYQLRLLDSDTKHYVVDEKNGILLDAYLLDETLVSTFKVEGNILTCTYALEDDHIIFSIYSYPEQVVRTSGDIVHDGTQIPMVYSYQTQIYQKAILRKRE